MAKALRWLGYGVLVVFILVVIAAAAIWFMSDRQLRGGTAHPEHLAVPTAAQLAAAPRQLQVLGCVGCHGDGLRGNLFFNEPHVGKIYAPNLTQIASEASDQQLATAIRQGIGTDGRALVIMPSTTFSRLDDSEVAALIAAIRALPKAGSATPKREIGPLGRIGLVTGKFHTQPELRARYVQTAGFDAGPQFARGRHLVASRCAECHGPDLKGFEVEPGVVGPDLTIVGAYDLPAFTKLLRTGVPPGGRKLKLMDEVARSDLSHYTDDEIAATHAYLVERAQHAP